MRAINVAKLGDLLQQYKKKLNDQGYPTGLLEELILELKKLDLLNKDMDYFSQKDKWHELESCFFRLGYAQPDHPEKSELLSQLREAFTLPIEDNEVKRESHYDFSMPISPILPIPPISVEAEVPNNNELGLPKNNNYVFYSAARGNRFEQGQILPLFNNCIVAIKAINGAFSILKFDKTTAQETIVHQCNDYQTVEYMIGLSKGIVIYGSGGYGQPAYITILDLANNNVLYNTLGEYAYAYGDRVLPVPKRICPVNESTIASFSIESQIILYNPTTVTMNATGLSTDLGVLKCLEPLGKNWVFAGAERGIQIFQFDESDKKLVSQRVQIFPEGKLLYATGDIKAPNTVTLYKITESGYDLCLMSNSRVTKIEKEKIYLRERSGRMAYTVITPNGDTIRDVFIDTIKAPQPFTLKELNILKNQILQITSNAGHTRETKEVWVYRSLINSLRYVLNELSKLPPDINNLILQYVVDICIATEVRRVTSDPIPATSNEPVSSSVSYSNNRSSHFYNHSNALSRADEEKTPKPSENNLLKQVPRQK